MRDTPSLIKWFYFRAVTLLSLEFHSHITEAILHLLVTLHVEVHGVFLVLLLRVERLWLAVWFLQRQGLVLCLKELIHLGFCLQFCLLYLHCFHLLTVLFWCLCNLNPQTLVFLGHWLGALLE